MNALDELKSDLNDLLYCLKNVDINNIILRNKMIEKLRKTRTKLESLSESEEKEILPYLENIKLEIKQIEEKRKKCTQAI